MWYYSEINVVGDMAKKKDDYQRIADIANKVGDNTNCILLDIFYNSTVILTNSKLNKQVNNSR